MAYQPLIPNENPQRAPESDEEVEGAAANVPAPRLNAGFLRVNVPPPETTQPPKQQPPAQSHPVAQSGAAPNTNQAPGVQPVAAPMPGYQYVQVPVYNVWTDPNVVGQLAVVVERANLVKNYGLTNMNPYCRMRVGHNMSNTRIAEGAGKKPAWNQRLALPLTKGIDMIYMEVFDSCVLSSDQMVAWACIPISEELILTGGDNGSKSHTLSGKQGADLEGTIQIRMSLTLSKDMAKMGANQPPFTMMMPPVGMYPAPYGPYGCPPMYPPYAATPHLAMNQYSYAMPANTNVHIQRTNYPQNPSLNQQPQRFQPMPLEVSEADVISLKETFPEMDREVIKGVLENAGGNRDRAADLLLQMG